jgi:hypothetical protein
MKRLKSQLLCGAIGGIPSITYRQKIATDAEAIKARIGD